MRLAVALMLVGLACTDATGPVVDPSLLRDDLTAVEAVFAAPVVRSAGFFSSVAVLPLPAPAPGGPLLPDSLLGTTLAWSCATKAYAVTADSGAPRTGVRLRLYQLAADGSIACPDTVIGQLDVFDASTVANLALRAVATTNSGVPLIDYTLSRGLTDPSGTSHASGFVSDGRERLEFELTAAYNTGAHSSVSTVQLDDAARDFHAALQHSADMGVDTYSEDNDLTLRRGVVTLELQGFAAWANWYRSWDETVTVNGAPFARVSGTNVPDGGGPTVTPAAGSVLTGPQRLLVLDVVDTPGTLGSALDRVLGGAKRLVLAP